MFFLGHLGIGSRLVSPFTRGLPKNAVLLGTILPDLVDKGLYYSLATLTGKNGLELYPITGTRTIGHTALFLFIITGIAIFRKSKFMAALSLGIASHLILDSVLDYHIAPFKLWVPLLWPFPGWTFPVFPFHNPLEHLHTVLNPFIFWSEVIGVLLLAQDYFSPKLPSRLRRRTPHVKPNR